jgi:hypothetical protein
MVATASYYVQWEIPKKVHTASWSRSRQRTFNDHDKAIAFASKLGEGLNVVVYNHESMVVYGKP